MINFGDLSHCNLSLFYNHAGRLVLAPHAAQNAADLAQGDVVLHAGDEQRHQVVAAMGRAFQLGQQLAGADGIPPGAQGCQTLRAAPASIAGSTFRRSSSMLLFHLEGVDAHHDLLAAARWPAGSDRRRPGSRSACSRVRWPPARRPSRRCGRCMPRRLAFDLVGQVFDQVRARQRIDRSRPRPIRRR